MIAWCNNAMSRYKHRRNMKKLLTLVLLAGLCSCGVFRGHKGNPGWSGPQGEKGEQGEVGAAGQDGKDGADADINDLLFRETSTLGVYEEQADYSGTATVQVTCMLGNSVDAGRVVLRIRTAVGGIADVEKVGGDKDVIYLPAAKEIFLISKVGNGTYKVSIDGSSSTKACSPL